MIGKKSILATVLVGSVIGGTLGGTVLDPAKTSNAPSLAGPVDVVLPTVAGAPGEARRLVEAPADPSVTRVSTRTDAGFD